MSSNMYSNMASATVNTLATRSRPSIFQPRLKAAERAMEIGLQSLRIEALCRSTRQALRPLRVTARCGPHPELEIALCARALRLTT